MKSKLISTVLKTWIIAYLFLEPPATDGSTTMDDPWKLYPVTTKNVY